MVHYDKIAGDIKSCKIDITREELEYWKAHMENNGLLTQHTARRLVTAVFSMWAALERALKEIDEHNHEYEYVTPEVTLIKLADALPEGKEARTDNG